MAAIAREIALVADVLLEEQLEAIPRLQIALEVDVAREDLGKRDRQLDFSPASPTAAMSDGLSRSMAPVTVTVSAVLAIGSDFGANAGADGRARTGDAKEEVAIDLVDEFPQQAIEPRTSR